MTQKAIGSTFAAEIAAAGLAGLPFSWDPQGNILFAAGMTEPQKAAVMAAYAAHDPVSGMLRSAKRQAIDAAYQGRVAAGVAHGGHVWQIDPESRGNIASRATRAGMVIAGVVGVTWPEEGMPFRSRENVWVSFTPQGFLAMAQAVDDAFTAVRLRYAGLKDALQAAADAEAIAAIDETAGWPA